MDKTAIEEITKQAAAIALNKGIKTDFPIAVLPDGYMVHCLEDHQDLRNNYRASYETHHIASFLDYYKEFGPASVYVNQDEMGAMVIFDAGTLGEPGHGDHKAALKLQKTSHYQAFLSVALAPHEVRDGDDYGRSRGIKEQREAAEWFEDWRECITAYDEDENPIEIKKVIAAIRNITIKNESSSDSTEGHLSKSRSLLDSTSAESKEGALPVWLEFSAIPYHGLGEHKFAFRMAIRSNREKPGVAFIRIRPERDSEEIAEQFVDFLQAELNDSVIRIGSYKL